MSTYYTGALFRKMGVQHAAARFFPNYSLSDNLLLFQNHTLQKCCPFSPVEIRNQMSQNYNIKSFNPFLASKIPRNNKKCIMKLNNLHMQINSKSAICGVALIIPSNAKVKVFSKKNFKQCAKAFIFM